jgi:hypothetical protein
MGVLNKEPTVWLTGVSLLTLCSALLWVDSGNTKEGSITVPLTSCLTGLDYSILQIKTKIVSCHTADSKPVKQEVNGTVILPSLVFPGRLHVCTARHTRVSNSFKLCIFMHNVCLIFHLQKLHSPFLILGVRILKSHKYQVTQMSGHTYITAPL